MRLRWLVVAGIAMGFACGLAWPFAAAARAQVGLTIPNPDKLRFRLVGDEPIASPDMRSVVLGWKVVVFRDTMSDQCYVTFISGSSISTTGPSVCPQTPVY